MCEGMAWLGLAQPYSVCHITICKSWYAEVRVVTIPVIYFHKIYYVWGESKVMVGTIIVLYVTQHSASHDMQGLGLAQYQLYIFIKPTMWEGKARLGLAQPFFVCHPIFCKSSHGRVRVGTNQLLFFIKPMMCEGNGNTKHLCLTNICTLCIVTNRTRIVPTQTFPHGVMWWTYETGLCQP